ncbi:MAG: cytochrome C [Tagaea sp. CACIAM 22H2]|jgi:mono/diheme cytochrome c family protein|nr:cytochrome C [Tagaea sp. CACIAM 22H2]
MRAPIWVAAIAALVVAAGLGAYFAFDRGPSGPRSDPAFLAKGERVYAEFCAACHGANLEGQPDWRIRKPDGRLPAPPHDATGHTWHHPMADLFALTKYGLARFAGPNYQSDMPAFEGRLSDDEIWAVLAYIHSRWPDDIKSRYAQIDRRRPQ